MRSRSVWAFGVLLCTGPLVATSHAAEPLEALAAQVRAREAAFAKTMADRDLAAFGTFVAEEAVFLGQTPLHGRKAVVEGWKRFYEGKDAPFSWKPERVEVIAAGTIALSTGPVFDPKGQRTGTFTSTWRREADGQWRVLLDSGCPNIGCPACP